MFAQKSPQPLLTVARIKQKALPAMQAAVLTCRAQSQLLLPTMVTLVIDHRFCLFCFALIFQLAAPAMNASSCLYRSADGDDWLFAHAATVSIQTCTEPVEVCCAAPCRWLPTVKHTQWIHSRYEQHESLRATKLKQMHVPTIFLQLVWHALQAACVPEHVPAGP